jgi:FG-GAP repeat
MRKYISVFLLTALLLSNTVSTVAQIGMGGQPHPSAVLDLKSPANDKAFYPPRLTTAQRNAIINPQAGAFVYDIDKGTLYLHDGQNWLPLATSDVSLLSLLTRTVSDGASGDSFGQSVSISGDYAIVGAYSHTIGTNYDQGAAYVFVRSGNTWAQQAKLTASDATAFDQFGYSVAISGDYAVIGANKDDVGSNTDQGSAYIFVRSGTTWSQQAKLTATDAAEYDQFGYRVAISGDYAIVGAPYDDIGIIANQGSAYVFTRSGTTWNQADQLNASDGVAQDFFGESVAISGNYAIVGAYNDGVGSNAYQGSAYIFYRSRSPTLFRWNQQAKLIANDGAADDTFGNSVAISGDYAVVGAWVDDIGSNADQGSAYIFIRSGTAWSQQAKLTASDGAAGNRFGFSVAISGDYVVVGAGNATVGENVMQGSAYTFSQSGTSWSQLRKIPDNAPASTRNGISVGLSNGTYIIGGPGFQTSKGKVGFGTID